jgi:CheY-like chemotaxis protein
VKVAYTGADALLKLKEDRPDAITLDIYLPDANGLTILRKLKASPDTNRIPVIIISSSDEDRGARNLGADEYLSKPIDFPRLLQTLKAVKPSD